MTPTQKVALGKRAAEILDDEVFRAVVAVAESALVEEWKGGATPEAREAAHAKLLGLGAIVRELRAVHSQGRYIANEIARRKEAERK